ncbi:MAG: mechanosensitive ion channel [Planctomyces sp.]|nr:mechanosensitive ion channel [Planctomyces sp.]
MSQDDFKNSMNPRQRMVGGKTRFGLPVPQQSVRRLFRGLKSVFAFVVALLVIHGVHVAGAQDSEFAVAQDGQSEAIPASESGAAETQTSATEELPSFHSVLRGFPFDEPSDPWLESDIESRTLPQISIEIVPWAEGKSGVIRASWVQPWEGLLSQQSAAANVPVGVPPKPIPTPQTKPPETTTSNVTVLARKGPQEQNSQTGNGAEEVVTPPMPIEPTVVPAAPTITVESIAAQKAETEKLTDLTEEQKTQLAKYYQRATEQVTRKAESDQKYAELRTEKENAPTQIAEYKQLLAQTPQETPPAYPENASVAELDQLRLTDEERANEATRNLENWESRARVRTERKPQMPALIETTRQQVEEAEKALAAAAPEGEPAALTQARRLDQETNLNLLRSQLELYRMEQSYYDSLNDLFPLQRDLLTRNRNSAARKVELWKTVLSDARREESAREAQEAREKLQNAHPTLRTIAEESSELTVRRKTMQEYLGTRTKELSDVKATLSSLETRFRNVQDKEQRAGLTTAIGLLLRSQRTHLPDKASYQRIQERAEQDIVRFQGEQMQLEDDRAALGDLQSQVDETLETVMPGAEQNEPLRQMATELLRDRRQYLDSLLADYNAALQTLGETEIAARRLETLIEQYETHIDERVLWIRSASPVGRELPGQTLIEVQNFLFNEEWPLLTEYLIRDAQSAWPVYLFFMFAIGVLLGLYRRSRRFVSELVTTADKQVDSGIPLILLAMAVTIAMASAWSLLLAFAGWRIGMSELEFAPALRHATNFSAIALWLVNSFRTMCRKQGIAEIFLKWPESVVRSLHVNLLIYIVVGLPLSFMIVAAERLNEGLAADTVGRMAFILLCILQIWTLRRIVRPDGPVLGDLLRSRPTSLMYRLRWGWYSAAVGAPIILAILSMVGYQYTAEQLMIRVQLTLCLSIVIAIAYSMVMQWMLAARRQLAMKNARAKRAAALAAAQRETEGEAGVAPTPSLPPVEVPQVDISLLNQQMLRLIRGATIVVFLTFGWAIWGQVLPALQIFSRVELWTVIVEITEKVPGATDTAPTFREITSVESVTLGHVMFGLIVFVGAVLAARNLPGLLELSVLQKLPLDHGGRHAITTLCKYALLFTGVIIAFNSIGIGWGNVQWLVAALTVGLGFGLQEIFANFVSGLIILFERPIRIGDIVTIDGVSGTVSRIQIRATTITDWDCKEFIVPNKEFVTGKLLNWTLSDKTNRIVINVGVAYGTNTEVAMGLLQEIADSHPLLLKEPPSVVSFEGFGDSTLNLVLRCFLPNLDHRAKVITQLHTTINERLKLAGIEIAYPQRDLHIRTLPAGVFPPPTPGALGDGVSS